ncbi:MAG: SAM-dependent methyltransferase [Rhodospirillaceae bacterium]
MTTRGAWRWLVFLAIAAPWTGAACIGVPLTVQAATLRPPDVRYEPSEPEAVRVMLDLAALQPGERVYDLGCGDGRIVIAAVQRYAVHGVCVDIDPKRIAEARDNARRAGVEDRILFLNQDLYETDIGEADVVALFLYPDLNLKLRPKLQRELKPGARVVSHWHDMGDWKPQRTVHLRSEGRGRNIYLWTLPAK